MKNRSYYILKLVAIFLWLPASFCGRLKEPGKKVNVNVSEEIELLTFIQLLSGYPLVSKVESDFKQRVLQQFLFIKEDTISPYFLSMAGKKVKGRLRYHYFSFNKPVDLIMHYSLKEKKLKYPIEEQDASYPLWNTKKDTIERFLSLFQRLYDNSNFRDFIAQHQSFYNDMVRVSESRINEVNLIGAIEHFYREPRKSYNVILSPLQNAGGYSVSIGKNKEASLYAVVGATSAHKGVPSFDYESLTNELILHEFSHSFCNPIIDRYYSLLAGMEKKDPEFVRKMESMGYDNWKTILYEHLVRASVIRLIEDLYGAEKAAKHLAIEKENGFYLIDILNEELKNYQKNRSLTLMEYFPGIVQKMKDFHEQ